MRKSTMIVVYSCLFITFIASIAGYYFYGDGQWYCLVLNLAAVTVIALMMIFFGNKKSQCQFQTLFTRPKIHWWTFAIIAMMGILMRLVAFGQVPIGLNQDEVAMMVDADSLLHYGIDHNGYSFPVYLEAWGSGQNALLTYLTIPFIAMFGVNVFSARIVMAIFGILAMFAFYWLIKLVSHNPAYALIGMAVFAICPWSIMAARWGLESNLFPFIFVIALACLIKAGQSEKDRFWLFPACIFFGLSLYAYAIAYLFVPLFLLAVYIGWLVKGKIKDWGNFIGANLILAVIALPLILFVLVNWGWIAPIKVGVVTIPRLLAFRSNEIALSKILLNFANLLSIVVIQNDYLPHNSVFSFGFMYLISTVFIGLGLIRMIRNIKADRNFDLVVVLIAFLTAVLVGLLIENSNVNKVNILWISYLVIETYGIIEFAEINRYFAYAVAGINLVLFTSFIGIYFTIWNQNYAHSLSFKTGLVESIQFANQSKQAGEKIYFDRDLHEPYIYCLMLDHKNPQSYLESRYGENGFYKTNGYDDYIFQQPITSETDCATFDLLILSLNKYQTLTNLDDKNVKIFDYFVVLY